MIIEAISDSENSTASLPSIKKYLDEHYKLPANFNAYLLHVMRAMVEKNELEHPRIRPGSFKIVHKTPKSHIKNKDSAVKKKAGVLKAVEKKKKKVAANAIAEISKHAKSVKA